MKFVSILVLSFIPYQALASDHLDSPERVKAAIYVMYLKIGSQDLLNQPFYVGQARQRNKSIQQMVQDRCTKHLSETKFVNAQKGAGPHAKWECRYVFDSDQTGNIAWTALETDLNEQAYITNYCNSSKLTSSPKLLNSRNEISQSTATTNWDSSKSKTTNLVTSAFNPQSGKPVAISNPASCFHKEK